MPQSVLVVEDEYLIAMDIQAALQTRGWTVMGPTPSVDGALRLLADALPTIALLDVRLGDELITPVAELLKAKAIPFALMSAYRNPEEIGGEALSGVPNIGKPFDARVLMRTVESLVQAAGTNTRP